MDDLIYILALVAWVGYAFYKNSKKVKKNMPGRQEAESAPQKPDFRTLLEEMLMGEEARQAPWTEQQPPVTKGAYEYGNYEDVLEKIPEGPYETFENQSLETVESLEVADPERAVMYNYNESLQQMSPIYADTGTEEGRVREAFDLRKAVIYSAVLNRPYA
jgi:hypothetical protein